MSARRRKKSTSDERATLQDILEFFNGDPILITYGVGHAGRGWYLSLAEYPDEGSLFIGRDADLAALTTTLLERMYEHAPSSAWFESN